MMGAEWPRGWRLHVLIFVHCTFVASSGLTQLVI